MWTREEVEKAVPTLTEKLTQAVVDLFNSTSARTETITAEETIPLIERAIAADGTIPVRLIRPGWGSSGYYSRETLQRDGARVWPKGTKMYANHPTLSEERERPERDIRDIAAVLTEDPVLRDDPKHGPGLYSRAQVIETWRPQIEALAKSPAGLDLSIRADGTAVNGEAEGRKGRIVERIDKGRSVDFVTDGGAGGKVISLSESVRTTNTTNLSEQADRESCEREGGTWNEVAGTCQKKETRVSEAQALQEAQSALAEAKRETATEKARADRAEGALILVEARALAASELTKVRLPDAAKTRIVEHVTANPPMKDGALDKTAFQTSLVEATKTEAEYLKKVSGGQIILGMGASHEQQRDFGKELTEAFREAGFDEKSAERMATGRGN